MARKPRIPKPRAHRGRTRVTLNGVDHYLGAWDEKKNRPTPEAEQQYQELIGRWLANGRRLTDDENASLTVEDVMAAYVLFAQENYRATMDSPTGEMAQIRYALRPVRGLFGSIPARKFDAIALKRIQEHLAEQEHRCKKNPETGEPMPGTGTRLSRTTISDRVNRIRRCFRWAESEGMVPRGTWDHLRTVAPIKRGRTVAREPKQVAPVEWSDVEPVLEHLATPAVSGNSNEAKVPNADSYPGCVEELPGRASDEVAGSEGTWGTSSRCSGRGGQLSMTYAAARR